MLKKKIIFGFYLFILFFQLLFAENKLVTVFVDKTELILGSSLILTVEVDSKFVNDYELPKMPDFIIEQKKGSFNNGKNIYIYNLSPKTVGYFTIPEIKINNDISNPINIKVKEPEIYKTKSKIYNNNYSSNIFVKAGTDVSSVYVNQQLTYDFEFYSKLELASNPSYILPMFQDFWKLKPKVKSGYKLINGENYFTFRVSTLLYPMKEGEITIDPSTVSVVALKDADISSFKSTKELENSKKINVNLKTFPVKIKVYPLPEIGKPDDFSGAVGRYKIKSHIAKQTFMINEPINLYVAITGDGNINSVIEPDINLSEDIQKYAVSYKVKDVGWQSTKIFKYVLIPLTEGYKIIPTISFSYFSPDLKSYVTIKTNKIDINIKSGEYVKKDVKNMNSISDQNDIKRKINEIYTDINLKNYNRYFKDYGKTLLSVFVLFFMIIIFSCLYRLRLIFISKDKNKLKSKISYLKAVNYLKNAEHYVSQKDQIKFYFSVNMAIRLYLQSRINMNCVGMLKEDIKKNLKKNKINKDFINIVEKTLIDCEVFKFTPAISTQEYMKKIYNNVKNVIEQMDNFYEKNNN